MGFFIAGLLLALSVTFTEANFTCKEGTFKTAPWVSITVQVSDKFYNGTKNKFRIFPKGQNSRNNGSVAGSAAKRNTNRNILLSQPCFKIKQDAPLDNRTEELLSYFKCVARKRPKLNISWKKSGDPGWTQAVGQTMHGWDPFPNTYGAGCHLLGLFGENQSLENIRVTCGYNHSGVDGGQDTFLRLDILLKEKRMEVSYGKGKFLQFSENEESRTQHVSITQCELIKNIERLGPDGTGDDKSDRGKLSKSARYVVMVLVVLLAAMTGLNISNCAVKWRIHQDMVHQSITTRRRVVADALPRPTTLPLSIAGAEVSRSTTGRMETTV